MDEKKLKKHMIKVCKRLYKRNMLAAADGNVSYRLSDERILITPSGLAKAFIDEEDIALINLEGDVLQGKPSAERLMHLEVYRSCPQAKAVVHAHPPTAIAWSIAQPQLEELPSESLPEVILAMGRIPIVSYARPTTAAMGDNLKPYLPKTRVMILALHGGLSWGESLDEACNGMERLEHVSQILYMAEKLGGLSSLPYEELQTLQEMREQFGDRTL